MVVVYLKELYENLVDVKLDEPGPLESIRS